MTYLAVTKAGFDALQWGRRSSSGYFTGGLTELTAADTGDSSNMTRYKGALNANIALPEPVIVNVLGDDTRLSAYQFDGVNPVQFDLEMSVLDMDFLAAISGIDHVTEALEAMMPFGANGIVRAGMILLFTSNAKSQDSGFLNTAGYLHTLLFNCEVTYLGTGSAHQGAGSFRFRVTANTTDTLPDGRLISTVFPSVPNGECIGFEFTSENRVSYAALVGDGAETGILTAYKPVSTGTSRATIETTGFAADTVSAVVTTAPYEITVDGAAGSGKFNIARYEFVNYE